jgi:hypothetical protein
LGRFFFALGDLGAGSSEDFLEDAEAPFDDFLEAEAALLAGFSEASEVSATAGAGFLGALADRLAGFSSEVSEVSTTAGAGFLGAEAAALRGALGAAAGSFSGASGSEA